MCFQQLTVDNHMHVRPNKVHAPHATSPPHVKNGKPHPRLTLIVATAHIAAAKAMETVCIVTLHDGREQAGEERRSICGVVGPNVHTETLNLLSSAGLRLNLAVTGAANVEVYFG